MTKKLSKEKEEIYNFTNYKTKEVFPYGAFRQIRNNDYTAIQIEQLQSYYTQNGVYPNFYKTWSKLDANTIKTIENNDPILGIEVEVEGISNSWNNLRPSLFQWTADGSLKDHGVEFISAPTSPSILRSGLLHLWTCFNVFQKKLPYFEWRSSIHIHMNMQNRDIEHVIKLLFLYFIFEKSLFKFGGNDREQSIFCVPLSATSLEEKISPMIHGSLSMIELLDSWEKYSALNLKPLGVLGTVEFRHLGGTMDLNKIINWINLITQMDKYCHQVDYFELLSHIKTLNTTSLYQVFKEQVFGPECSLLLNHSDEPLFMGEGIKYAKRCLGIPFGTSKTVIKKPAGMIDFLEDKLLRSSKKPKSFYDWPNLTGQRIQESPITIHTIEPTPTVIYEDSENDNLER